MLPENIPEPVCRINAALVIVGTQDNFLQFRMRLQSLNDGFFIHTIRSDVGMLLPIVRIEREKTQQIDRCFKNEQPSGCPEMRKAVPGVRSLHRHLERLSKGDSAALACLSGSAVFVQPDKDSVVEFRILIERVCLCKMRNDLRRNEPLLDEIRIHPVHIAVRLRQNKFLFLLRGLVSGALNWFHRIAEECLHRLREGHSVEALHEFHRTAALLRLVVEPCAAADRDAVMLPGFVCVD